MNKLISIFIPTFNRCLILKKNLPLIIQAVRKHNIGLFIYDNASSDGTDLMIKNYQSEYPYLYYVKNKDNLGIDRNMLHCLECSEAEYILMLGDDDYILDNFYVTIENVLNESYDFIVLSQNKIYPTCTFTDCQEAFEFLWDKMPYGTLIIKNKLLTLEKMNKYIGTSHAYSATSWEIMSSEKGCSKCLFLSQEEIVKLGIVEKTWKSDALNIYMYQIPLWFSLLPPSIYTEKIKRKYISNILSFRSLFNFRKLYNFSLLTSKEYLSKGQCLKINLVDILFKLFYK